MGVGEKIKTLRKAMGLTQTELGERVGMKKNAVSKWECGRVEDIPTSTIKALAELFGVSPSYLIDDSQRDIDEELRFALFRGSEGITDEMYREVLDFAQFVARREAKKKQNQE